MIVGHGTITANGGNGGGAQGQAGGGGAGGRISVQCDNVKKFNITMQAYGGKRSEERRIEKFTYVYHVLIFLYAIRYKKLKTPSFNTMSATYSF